MNFKNIRKQIDSSLQYIRNLFDEYLRLREGKSYEEMLDLWKLYDLEIHFPQRKVIKTNNEEAETVLQDLPNLEENIVDYNKTVNRNIRGFLIVHKLIEEIKNVYESVELYYNSNNSKNK
uniref:Uncharacterized protein n=1 Tax=Glossina austeni TaxID=7395 RepID=A0A1A9USF2_GLOAU